MTNEERIKRLEQMVKSLADTVFALTHVINTGSYEYSLIDIRHELSDIKSFELESDKAHDHTEYFEPALAAVLHSTSRCPGLWHGDQSIVDQWCGVCGKSIR